MKKIYLLSAVACLFAFNAKADGTADMESWAKAAPSVKEIKFDQASNCVSFKVNDAGNTYAAQYNPPTWVQPGKNKNEAFEICFDAAYVGAGTEAKPNAGHITFIQGRQLGGYGGNVAEMCSALGIEEVDAAWKMQGAIEQLNITEYTDYDAASFEEAYLVRNVHFYPTKEWKHFSMKGTLGRHAADSIDLEMEFGDVPGAYSIKNFQFIVAGKVFAEYFMAPTAIAEDAAVTAFVANDVIFASEAADVVVYNVSGVAVKSAKNVTSLSVADLKAGLYIAKVGNATVKFVK